MTPQEPSPCAEISTGQTRGPVVVAGMHRSGTSLVASMLEASGIAMGDSQLAADSHNPRGYFEDVEFLSLQRRMLWAATPNDDGGHRDWGWTESESLAETVFPSFGREAKALLEARVGIRGLWGWKDPRTTLLLEFWRPYLPEAMYVFVYRHPWEVADSMQRLGAEVFLRHPEYAYRIWSFYNHRLLGFRRAHREQTLLVSAEALAQDPSRLEPLLASRLGIDGTGQPPAPFDSSLLHSRPADDPLVSLIAATRPDCCDLLAALDREADLSGAGTWQVRALGPQSASRPKVSVVIPCFEQGELLVEAVASAERAVAVSHEVIVVNDGSREPRTLEVLATLRDAGHRIIDQENRGLAGARNRGIEAAAAPYVLPLDADNRLRPGFVTAALAVLDSNPAVGVVYTDRAELGLRNDRVHVPPFDIATLLAGNFIDACTVLRKEVWRQNEGFDATMPAPGWEDWDLWIGTAGRGWKFEHLPIEGFDYRVRPGSMITAFEDPNVRRAVLGYLVGKHRDLYLAHLGELVFFAQDCTRRLWTTARSLDGTEADLQQAGASLVATMLHNRSLGRHVSTLEGELEGLRNALGEQQAEAERLRLTLSAVVAELDAWRNRVQVMEGTRAWRWRARLIAAKDMLRRRGRRAEGSRPGESQ